MDEEKSRVYIKTDSQNRITQIEGEYSLSNFADLSECILVEEGEPCDRLNHAQGCYLPNPLMDDRGVYQYKWTGSEIAERTAAEMDADAAAMPLPAPSAQEQLRADVDYLLMMEGAK